MQKEQNFEIHRHVKNFPPNDIIFKEDEDGREMFVILRGKVEIFKTIRNERYILAILKNGDFFGEMSTIRGLPRVATARTIEDTDCLVISPGSFRSILQIKPGFGIKIIKELCNRVESGNRTIEKLVLEGHLDKMVGILLDMATNGGRRSLKTTNLSYDETLEALSKRSSLESSVVEDILINLARYNRLDILQKNEARYIQLSNKLLQSSSTSSETEEG